MKKIYGAIRLFMLIGIFQLVSCNKSSDFVSSDSLTQTVSDDATTPVDLSACKIRRIKQDYGSGLSGAVSGLFTYNKAGNPISMTNDNNGTGMRDFYFFYDKKGRLIELRLTYDHGTVTEIRHKYGYNSSNVCVQDTLTVDEGGAYVTASTLAYDTKGRIIRETIKNIKNPHGPLDKTRVKTFTYDARGNLGVLGWKSSSYDTKISPLRTNPIYMLIHRNYSMNTPAVQKKYNSKGLPTVFEKVNYNFFNSNIIYQITYDCQ